MKYRNLGKKRLMALTAEAALQAGEAVFAGERQAGEVLTAVDGAALGLIRHETIGETLRAESGAAVSIGADRTPSSSKGSALDLTPLRGLQISTRNLGFALKTPCAERVGVLC